jgi:protein gp37
MKQAHRFSGPGGPYEGLTQMSAGGPVWTGKIKLVDKALGDPLRWKKPSDVFHEDVPDKFIFEIFTVMARCPQHVFQILTKRPERMRRFVSAYLRFQDGSESPARTFKPFPHVWLGVSVENQRTADERIPILLQTPAAVRWISAEPLLEPLDLMSNGYLPPPDYESDGKVSLDWVVCGAESGPGARDFDLQWARSLIRQCRSVNVPVFMKQVGPHPRAPRADAIDFAMRGSWKAEADASHYGIARPADRKGGDMSEWPENLRVRQFPGHYQQSGADDGDGHCARCGLKLDDPHETTEPHECPPGFTS